MDLRAQGCFKRRFLHANAWRLRALRAPAIAWALRDDVDPRCAWAHVQTNAGDGALRVVVSRLLAASAFRWSKNKPANNSRKNSAVGSVHRSVCSHFLGPDARHGSGGEVAADGTDQ